MLVQLYFELGRFRNSSNFTQLSIGDSVDNSDKHYTHISLQHQKH